MTNGTKTGPNKVLAAIMSWKGAAIFAGILAIASLTCAYAVPNESTDYPRYTQWEGWVMVGWIAFIAAVILFVVHRNRRKRADYLARRTLR